MKRTAWMINLKPEKVAEYRELHAAAWPSVLSQIRACSIRNYSIYLREPEMILVGTYEYHGNNFEADMARMAEDEDTRRWWALTDPCQTAFDSAKSDEWWVPMEEVFHVD